MLSKYQMKRRNRNAEIRLHLSETDKKIRGEVNDTIRKLSDMYQLSTRHIFRIKKGEYRKYAGNKKESKI